MTITIISNLGRDFVFVIGERPDQKHELFSIDLTAKERRFQLVDKLDFMRQNHLDIYSMDVYLKSSK